ncbi:hypothetical protein R80B4_00745 [Fibrobacteres bacterium R8-0-B4]
MGSDLSGCADSVRAERSAEKGAGGMTPENSIEAPRGGGCPLAEALSAVLTGGCPLAKALSAALAGNCQCGMTARGACSDNLPGGLSLRSQCSDNNQHEDVSVQLSRREKRTVETIAKNEKTAAAETAGTLRVNRRTVLRALKSLAGNGVVARAGSGRRGSRKVLKP